MNVVIISALVSALASITVVCITYFNSQKLKLFDSYFSNKVRTYENYWVCASNYIKSRSQDDFSILRAASYSVGMFASDKLFIEIDLLTNMIFQGAKLSEQTSKVINLMREDLDKCKNGKFR